jgi:hypothetical protein
VELVVLLADSFFDAFCAVELVLEEAAGVTLHPASSCDAAVSTMASVRRLSQRQTGFMDSQFPHHQFTFGAANSAGNRHRIVTERYIAIATGYQTMGLKQFMGNKIYFYSNDDTLGWQSTETFLLS